MSSGPKKPREAVKRRLRLFLRAMEQIASRMSELSDVLLGRAESFETEPEILHAIVQARRRARVLAQPWLTKKPRRRLAGGRARHRGEEPGGQPVLDMVREVGQYDSELGTWPSIFDAMLDLSQRVVLAQPWDVAMGVLYDEAILFNPRKSMEEQEQVRAWAIRKSILGNRAVGSAIAATLRGVSEVKKATLPRESVEVLSMRAPAGTGAFVTFSYLSKAMVNKVYDSAPGPNDAQFTSDSRVHRIISLRGGLGAKNLWEVLSTEWLKNPHRSFSSSEACGVFVETKQNLDGGQRRIRDHLRSIAADGKPILIKTRSGSGPFAYYLMLVLEVGQKSNLP